MRISGVPDQVAEHLGEECVDFRQRCFGLGSLLDKRGAVGGLLELGEIAPERFVGGAQTGLPQRVKIGAAAARETEISRVKEIELAAKRRLGPSRAFGHGGDAAQVRREPLDDEARLGERTGAENEAGCGFGVQGE